MQYYISECLFQTKRNVWYVGGIETNIGNVLINQKLTRNVKSTENNMRNSALLNGCVSGHGYFCKIIIEFSFTVIWNLFPLHLLLWNLISFILTDIWFDSLISISIFIINHYMFSIFWQIQLLSFYLFQVKHFDRKRTYLKFKEQIEKEGYVAKTPDSEKEK